MIKFLKNIIINHPFNNIKDTIIIFMALITIVILDCLIYVWKKVVAFYRWICYIIIVNKYYRIFKRRN